MATGTTADDVSAPRFSPRRASLPRVMTDPVDSGIQLEKERYFSEYFWADLYTTVNLGLPLLLGGASRNVQQIVVSTLLGRKSTVLLAGMQVADVWTAWVDQMVASGTGQIGTLCSMAWGAKNYLLVGTWLQIGIVFVTVLYPPFALFRLLTGPVLKALGVPALVADTAGTYAMWSAPTMLLMLYYLALHNYYSSMRIVKPDMYICFFYIFVAAAV